MLTHVFPTLPAPPTLVCTAPFPGAMLFVPVAENWLCFPSSRRGSRWVGQRLRLELPLWFPFSLRKHFLWNRLLARGLINEEKLSPSP